MAVLDGRNGAGPRDASDIVFTDDEIAKLPGLLKVSRRTMSTIIVGIAASMGLNLCASFLAFIGAMGPVVGALVHNAGSVAVVASVATIVRYDPWTDADRGARSAHRAVWDDAPAAERSR